MDLLTFHSRSGLDIHSRSGPLKYSKIDLKAITEIQYYRSNTDLKAV